MRRAILTTALVLVFAAPASAEPFIYPYQEPELPVDPDTIIVCGYCPGQLVRDWIDRLGVPPVSIAIQPEDLVAAEADPPETRQFAVAAYGEGTTTCTLTLEKRPRSFGGATSCSRALSQTAQAWAGSTTGPLCSGMRSSCTSSGTTTSAYTTLRYRVTLTAPSGQGWVAPPAECSGAGTDRLDCTFSF